MSTNRIGDLLKQADTTPQPDATPEMEGLKTLDGKAKDVLVDYLEEVQKRSGEPMGPGIITLMLLVGAQASASLWALLHVAQWVTFHDPETDAVLSIGECDPGTCIFKTTPLFKTDPNLLPAAAKERSEING